ncbi:MAG TPA: hypothetical protein VJL34_03920 [Anaerolineales bacterium]|nr:hypothetical protein [Anaerolineales bacterium]
MDAIREQFNKPLVMGAAGVVVGLILGIIYGWLIDPVEWTDAAVVHLRQDLQAEYLRMAIESYAQNPDAPLAIKRFGDLGENGDELLEAVAVEPKNLSIDTIRAYGATVQAQLPLGAGETPTDAGSEAEGAAAGRGVLGWLLPVMCVVILGVAGGAVYVLYGKELIARWRSGTAASESGGEASRAGQKYEWTDFTAMGEEPPLFQFLSSYQIGDDRFEHQFDIESPSGEFLGSCGIGILETLGVGEPKKVTAFEVWLFEAKSAQTDTKVLMSAHAYLNEGIRKKLEGKGELVLAEQGSELVMQTNSLRMIGRVVDMSYAPNALAADGVFDHLILEKSVWQKASA